MTFTNLLLVDAGHTRIKFARVNLGEQQELPVLKHVRAVMLGDPIPWNEIELWFQPEENVHTCLVGSNPNAVMRLQTEWRPPLPPPQLLADKSQIPLRVQVEQPHRVGIDRLLNAVAANKLRNEHQTAVIADTGTAITVDCVSSQGVFCGGAILPGLRMGAKALHQFTNTLPELDTTDLFAQTPTAIGRITEAALASGLYWGHVGAIRELIFRVRDELAGFDKAKDALPLILITGGAAELLRPHFPLARYEPHLALQGLALTIGHLGSDAKTSN